MTAAVIVQLVQEGKLRFNDAVSAGGSAGRASDEGLCGCRWRIRICITVEATCFLIAIRGGGPYSVDRVIGKGL
jgi:hypothetical protein